MTSIVEVLQFPCKRKRDDHPIRLTLGSLYGELRSPMAFGLRSLCSLRKPSLLKNRPLIPALIDKES